MIDTKELRRLAQAATPGPWINHGRQPNVAGLPHSAVAAKTLLARVYSEAYGDVEQETANASFIAAANPATLSELLDRLEAAEKERDFAKAEIARLHDDAHELTDERGAYKAACNEWAQDELTRGKLPAKYLGMPRADGIKVELDALRAKIEAAEKERDNANAAAVNIALEAERLQCENDALHAALQHETDCLEAAKAEIEALRARIEAMERQGPVAWARKLGLDVPSFGCVTDLKYRPSNIPESSYIPLYALPGAQAQPAPSVPEVTDAMALAFHHALTDGSIGAREVEEIKDALRAALAATTDAKP